MATIEPTTLTDELRAAIAASGLTAYTLAKRTGLAKNTVVNVVNGGEPSLDNAAKIARAIGLKIRLGKKIR